MIISTTITNLICLVGQVPIVNEDLCRFLVMAGKWLRFPIVNE